MYQHPLSGEIRYVSERVSPVLFTEPYLAELLPSSTVMFRFRMNSYRRSSTSQFLLDTDLSMEVALNQLTAVNDQKPIYPPRWAMTKSIYLSVATDLYSTSTFTFWDHNALRAFVNHIGPKNTSYLRKLRIIISFPIVCAAFQYYMIDPRQVIIDSRNRLKALPAYGEDALEVLSGALRRLRDLQIITIEVNDSGDKAALDRYTAAKHSPFYSHGGSDYKRYEHFLSDLAQLSAVSKRKKIGIANTLQGALEGLLPDCRIDLSLPNDECSLLRGQAGVGK